MEDLGAPIAYTVLDRGAKVLSSDGEELGKVSEVLCDTSVDIFDGLILATGPLGSDHRYVAAEQVDEIFEHGVLLNIDSTEAAKLPERPRD